MKAPAKGKRSEPRPRPLPTPAELDALWRPGADFIGPVMPPMIAWLLRTEGRGAGPWLEPKWWET